MIPKDQTDSSIVSEHNGTVGHLISVVGDNISGVFDQMSSSGLPIEISKENRKVVLDLTIDIEISPVLNYFEIFMERTMMSKHAAKYLDIWFELVINDTKLL